MQQFINGLYLRFPELHRLDFLRDDPTAAIIIEICLIALILCLWSIARQRKSERILASEAPGALLDLAPVSGKITALDRRLASLEKQMDALNTDMTLMVQHMIVNPGEPLRVDGIPVNLKAKKTGVAKLT